MCSSKTGDATVIGELRKDPVVCCGALRWIVAQGDACRNTGHHRHFRVGHCDLESVNCTVTVHIKRIYGDKSCANPEVVSWLMAAGHR